MQLHELGSAGLQARLQGAGLTLCNGPFQLRLQGAHAAFADQLLQLYAHTSVLPPDGAGVHDFTLRLERPRGPRRWLRPQIRLVTDIETPFQPFPLDHALPLFEWGYNWCIGMQAHQFLMLHSAVVEKDGLAVVMPALSGSGKSTLCAALMLRGWRLLSDEFGLLRPHDPTLRLYPLPRPIPLKNTSIAAVRAFAPDAALGPTFAKTRKGDVAHVAPTPDSQLRRAEAAPAGWVLFPKFARGSATHIDALPRGWTFLKVSGNSFNYRLHGAAGFDTLADLVEQCPAHAIRYSDMEDAVQRIDALHAQIVAARHHRADGSERG